MKLKLSQPEWISLLFAIFFFKFTPSASSTDKEKKISNENIITEKPIIIHTQEQNYNQPTLRDYQECHYRRDKCMRVCETTDNVEFCKNECLVCPILFNQDILIQGINDTTFQSPIHTTVNTTNVIRLTNEIRNIIDSNISNITSRNENNIFMHQNISMNGGKYGLGYNADGDCCLIVRSGKNCNLQGFSIGARCHHKRHRVCGARCKARVMYAKRVFKCKDKNENCAETIDYTTNAPKHTNSGCYTNRYWPFIVCGRHELINSNFCHQCLKIPYGFILHYGVPSNCVQCLHFSSNNFGSIFSKDLNEENESSIDDTFLNESDWLLNKAKCRTSDGMIIDCSNLRQGLNLRKNTDVEKGSLENDVYMYGNTEKSGLNYEDFSLEKLNSIERYRRSRYSKRHKKFIDKIINK